MMGKGEEEGDNEEVYRSGVSRGRRIKEPRL
jgi:hypothetical protein